MSNLTVHYSGSARGIDRPWLVLEQEGVQDDKATVGDTADLLDKLFDLTPCTEVIEGGEEAETDEEGAPAVSLGLDEVKTIVREEFGFASCGDGDGDRYLLRVYRSDISMPYKLLFDNGEQISVVQKNSYHQAVVAVDLGDRAELDYPVADPERFRYRWRSVRDRTGALLPVSVSVVGRYLQFPREVAGLLEIGYPVAYDLVEIRIPRKDDEPGQCRVTALYAGTAEEIDIKTVAIDPAMDGFARRFGCSGGDDDYEFPDNDEPVCYERIYHRVLCRCTKEDSGKSYWTEDEVPCPDWLQEKGYSGRFSLGSRSLIEKYVDCGGAVEGTGTAQEYEDICCEPGTPPECDKIYRKFGGGKAYDREAAIAEYGANVVLIPVGPRDGQCGEWVTEYKKPPGNCCDNPPELLWEKTHDVLSWWSSYTFRVDGESGIPPYSWSVSGYGLSVTGDGANGLVSVSDCFTGGEVIATDACGQQVVHEVASDSEAIYEDLIVDEANSADIIADNSSGWIRVEGGKLPLSITVDGVGFWADEGRSVKTKTFNGREFKIYTSDACGGCSVEIKDACGDIAWANPRATLGEWVDLGVDANCVAYGDVSEAEYNFDGNLRHTWTLEAGLYRTKLVVIVRSDLVLGTLSCSDCPVRDKDGEFEDFRGDTCGMDLAAAIPTRWPCYASSPWGNDRIECAVIEERRNWEFRCLL